MTFNLPHMALAMQRLLQIEETTFEMSFHRPLRQERKELTRRNTISASSSPKEDALAQHLAALCCVGLTRPKELHTLLDLFQMLLEISSFLC